MLALLVTSSFSLAEEKGQLAIIIDDIGYNWTNGKQIAQLPLKITLAILPFTPHAKTLAELGHHHNKEIMLHTPMSNEHHLPLGPGGLGNDITQKELIDVLDKNLAAVPYVKGINNHMGSQLTQNKQVMSWLMIYLKARNLYFVDSRTTPKTVALSQAKINNLPGRKRDVFLDDNPDANKIQKQLELAIKLAKKNGSAIAIGHPYKQTLSALQALDPTKVRDIEFVHVSDLFLNKDVSAFKFCPITREPNKSKSIFDFDSNLYFPN